MAFPNFAADEQNDQPGNEGSELDALEQKVDDLEQRVAALEQKGGPLKTAAQMMKPVQGAKGFYGE